MTKLLWLWDQNTISLIALLSVPLINWRVNMITDSSNQQYHRVTVPACVWREEGWEGGTRWEDYVFKVHKDLCLFQTCMSISKYMMLTQHIHLYFTGRVEPMRGRLHSEQDAHCRANIQRPTHSHIKCIVANSPMAQMYVFVMWEEARENPCGVGRTHRVSKFKDIYSLFKKSVENLHKFVFYTFES